MSPYSSLQDRWKHLQEIYTDNLHDVHALQSILIDQILPAMGTELDLDENALQESKSWLQDTSSIFHFLRRNSFTRSFAMESIRKVLLWRLEQRESLAYPHKLTPAFMSLPNSFDLFGHPIIVFQVSSFLPDVDDIKSRVIRQVEDLRRHLQHLNTQQDYLRVPLQYVIILDCGSLSTRNLNVDLMTWLIREIMPRFPGLFACAFLINYSWTQAGIWNIIKHILSSAALSKLMHLSTEELLEYCGRSSLPIDYGGDLPPLSQLQSQEHLKRQSSHQPLEPDEKVPITTPIEPRPPLARIPSFLSPISFLNPFFGYPTQSEPVMKYPSRESPRHTLRHGRRRKRDLAKTLLLLLWMRWRKRLGYLVAIVLFSIFSRMALRRWRARAARNLWNAMTKPK